VFHSRQSQQGVREAGWYPLEQVAASHLLTVQVPAKA
jgi:hypothetical protein